MSDPVSKKQIREAEEQAQQFIRDAIKESRSTKEVLDKVKWEISYIEDELGKRSIPYGGGFVAGHGRRKRLKRQYFPGVPGDILDAKWHIYKDFVRDVEEEMIPKSRREELIMYDRGHTLAELRAMCRKKGLVVSGSKKELIARLI